MKKQCGWIIAGLILLLCLGFSGNALSVPKGGRTMKITSSAFKEREMIPLKYTCDGRDISPSLEWDNVPDGTKSFALICDDPDAPRGTWVHWVVYDIPPSVKKLDENVRPEAELESGIRQGKNDWPKIGYGGPCSTQRHSSVLFQAVCAGHDAESCTGSDQRAIVEGNEGACSCRSPTHGEISKAQIKRDRNSFQQDGRETSRIGGKIQQEKVFSM